MILRTVAAVAVGLSAILAAQPLLAQDKDHRPMTTPGQPMDRDMDRKLDRDDQNQAQAPNESQRLNPNSNGRGALDRDTGRDRSEDRTPLGIDQNNRTYRH